MHISGLGVVVCDVHVITQDAVEFCCIFAKTVFFYESMKVTLMISLVCCFRGKHMVVFSLCPTRVVGFLLKIDILIGLNLCLIPRTL